MTTGLLYDERFLKHFAGIEHPERPERLRAVHQHLSSLPWFSELIKISARTATLEEIQLVHDKHYVERAKKACETGEANLDTPDVGISKDSFDVALLAAGSSLALADAVMEGKIQNGFGLVRPPGHHAERAQAMGFCLFNNIAITARYLQKKHAIGNILILDWDVHHGNGTQHIFEEDPSVFYVSLHQYPFYPGTGAAEETGRGKGKGATLNCPLRTGSGDFHYQDTFTDVILPRVREYAPEFILISAGFDAHARDPLATMNVGASLFGWMTDRLKEEAKVSAKNRIVSLLEGGYDLEALSLCIEKHLLALKS